MEHKKSKEELLNRYNKIIKELKDLAWKEYDMGWGTQRRAKISRKCDVLAMEKQRIREELFDEYGIEL